MIMRKWTLCMILSILVVVGCSSIASTKASDSRYEIAGTIRNTGTKWDTIDNDAHQSMNITGVRMLSNAIQIDHKVGAKKVITFIVTPDETMAQAGYRVGVSAGLDYSYIYIYDKNGQVVDPKTYVNESANIWIYGILK